MCLFSNEKELVASANILAGTRNGQGWQHPYKQTKKRPKWCKKGV